MEQDAVQWNPRLSNRGKSGRITGVTFGIPAVVGTGNAPTGLRPGGRVRVGGGRGTVAVPTE